MTISDEDEMKEARFKQLGIDKLTPAQLKPLLEMNQISHTYQKEVDSDHLDPPTPIHLFSTIHVVLANAEPTIRVGAHPQTSPYVQFT